MNDQEIMAAQSGSSLIQKVAFLMNMIHSADATSARIMLCEQKQAMLNEAVDFFRRIDDVVEKREIDRKTRL